MPRLKPVTQREFIKRMHELGFEGPYSGGRHPQMRRDNVTIIIPNTHEGEISIDFLTRLLRQAGITREEWLKTP